MGLVFFNFDALRVKRVKMRFLLLLRKHQLIYQVLTQHGCLYLILEELGRGELPHCRGLPGGLLVLHLLKHVLVLLFLLALFVHGEYLGEVHRRA